MTHTVAALCLLPDTGHVMPLLRLARLVGRHLGARVIAFLPARFEQAATGFGFEFRRIDGIDPEASRPVLEALSRKTIFYSAFSYDQDLLDGYWAALHEAVGRELGHIDASLVALRPSLLLTDSHVFEAVYRLLAARCDAMLVMNRSGGGALRYQPRLFTRVYGLSGLPGWWQRVVEIGGDLHARTINRWRRHRHVTKLRLTEARVASLQDRAVTLFAGIEPARERAIVTSGISAIEHRVASGHVSLPEVREVLLAPTIDTDVAPLPAELESWLAAQPRGRIVYVGFGTMVRPRTRFMRRLLAGLMAADVSVVWALGREQREWIRGARLPEKIRFEDFAPQTSLLVAGRVDCFVTHAGLGGVQEALMGGVPMLCIPFLGTSPTWPAWSSAWVRESGVSLRHSRKGGCATTFANSW